MTQNGIIAEPTKSETTSDPEIRIGTAATTAGVIPSRAPATLAQLPKLFLVMGVVLVVAYTVIVPPFQVTDEDRHVWRAYSVSDLHFVGPRQAQIPLGLVRLHDRFWPFLEIAPGKERIVRAAELMGWLRQPLGKESKGVENPAANLYSFVPYLTTGFTLRVGRLLGWSALGLIYGGRLANAAMYLCLMYISLRLLPEFRLLLLTIALSPMSLNLAASFSADSLTLALIAVFTAFVFKLAFDENVTSVSVRHRLLLIFLTVTLALCKSNVWISLLVLLIPARKFRSRGKAALFATVCVLSAFVAAFVWQRINGQAVAAFRAFEAEHGKSVPDNIAFLFGHPFRFGAIMLLTDVVSSWTWLQEFIGRFGWLTIQMSPVHALMYTTAIVLAAYTQSAAITIARWQKLIIASFVLLTVLSLHVLLWTFETSVQVLQHASTSWVRVSGMQGRYFLPVALPALALLGKRRFRLDGLLLVGVLATVVIINTMALLTIWQVYS